MNKFLIFEYIKRLRKEDIISFSINQGIELPDSDLETIYYYLKNEVPRFLNNPKEILNELKIKLTPNTYNYTINLYNQYKNYLDQ